MIHKLFDRPCAALEDIGFGTIAAALGFECRVLWNGEDWASPDILVELNFDEQEKLANRWAKEFEAEEGWHLAATWVNEDAEMIATIVRPVDGYAAALWGLADKWEEAPLGGSHA